MLELDTTSQQRGTRMQMMFAFLAAYATKGTQRGAPKKGTPNPYFFLLRLIYNFLLFHSKKTPLQQFAALSKELSQDMTTLNKINDQ